MAQDESTELFEIDTSHMSGFQFSLKWPIRTPEAIDAFVNCEKNKGLRSGITTNFFQLGQEKIALNWHLTAYPKGDTDTWEDSENLVIITTFLDLIPRAKVVDIKSLEITHSTWIPEIHFSQRYTNVFHRDRLGWNGIHPSDKINNNVFTKYNVMEHGGFDINAKIWIQNIKCTNNVFNQRLQLCSDSYTDVNQEILNVLQNMNLVLGQMSSSLTCNSNYNNEVKDNTNSCNSNDQPDNDHENVANQLSQWILNMFENNKKMGKEYVKIITNYKEKHFNDIDAFCNVNENDLKEMGINKKGHRMKFLRNIRKYKGRKIQSLMMKQKIHPAEKKD